MQALVTGGAGFLGSHLTARLLAAGHRVTVVDDLSTGRREWVHSDAEFVEGSLTAGPVLREVFEDSYDVVFHLACRSAVNDADPRGQFRENTDMTASLVAAVLEAGVPELVFASSSTVYGDAPRPTPESYAPLEPISAYGVSKHACEAMLSTVAHAHDLTVSVCRFANVVGPRLRDAVIPDFIEKLRADPETLRILGNGQQEKSYIHVEDCIDAMLCVYDHASGPVATYNIGTHTTTSVTHIADIVAEELGLSPEYEYTGGTRGWSGDIPEMCLAIEKVAGLGWEPALESDAAVRLATRELLAEMDGSSRLSNPTLV